MDNGITKIESDGSLWWFAEDALEYMRLPKSEAGREYPEWGDHRAGALQDGVWHPYDEYIVTEYELLIFHHGRRCVRAPHPRVIHQASPS